MLERVNCNMAGCDICSEGICVGTNFLGDKMYSCIAYRKSRHKKVNARDCGKFRCNNNSDWPVCQSCRRGK